MGLTLKFKLNVDLPSPARSPLLAKSFGAPAKAEVTNQPDEKRIAVLIVHGMGQQVPFQTISQLMQGILTKHEALNPNNALPPNVTVNLAKLTSSSDAPVLMRAECRLSEKQADGKPDKIRNVHVFEGYWAPLTEGEITFLEVISRLYRAGWNGIRARLKASTFGRWMFNGSRPMNIKTGTLSLLLLTLLILSLVVPLLLLSISSVGELWKFTKSIVLDAPSWWPGVSTTRYWGAEGPNSLSWAVSVTLIMVGIIALLRSVRNLIIQYVGDVIIYVSSQDLNRWCELRGKIQDTVLKTAKQIYSAGKDGSNSDGDHMPYDEVVIVGHSLGSVVAYDTLNALINWDEVEMNNTMQVQPRTRHLITFGSPLDKTAFLFRTQVKEPFPIREAMAARKQPLILDYARYRPLGRFEWVNIHSSADIISGELEYYDYKDESNPQDFNPIRNERDQDARIPLVAHVQYWENDLLHKELYRAIFN